MDREVSVIIPILNSATTLENCLQAVRGSSYKDYELIAVNDASDDDSGRIAEKFADFLVTHRQTRGEGASRNSGAKTAKGNILVFLDSDVVIKPDALGRTVEYFKRHKSVVALSGRLSKEHPNNNFFSQYKNLYMYYIFGLLPERVNFLYGSIHAIRKNDFMEYSENTSRLAADTELGLKFINRGQEIAFLKDLEVVHFKKHNFLSFLKNDFKIPFAWIQIFIEQQGIKQLFKNNLGFAHSPKKQIISIIVSFLILALGIFVVVNRAFLYPLFLLIIAYYMLNRKFLAFLTKEKGYLFGFTSFFITYLDNLVMSSGIICGLTAKFIHLLFSLRLYCQVGYLLIFSRQNRFVQWW